MRSLLTLFGLGLVVGCAANPAAPPESIAPRVSPPEDLQAVIDLCDPSGEEPWTHADCDPDHSCWTRGGAECHQDTVVVEDLRAVISSGGEVAVSGVLVCKSGSTLRPRAIVATTAASDAPRRALGHVEVETSPNGSRDLNADRGEPGDLEPWRSVDPVPLLEDFRVPFRINLSTSGIPLTRDKDGNARASLFGLGSSEDGPGFMLLVKFSF